jgi:ParB family chromosome partitioning protein
MKKKITSKILENVPIEDLIPYEMNANKGDDEKVAASLKSYGYPKVSISVDENMILLCGHTTVRAMGLIGWKKAPKVLQVSGLSEVQKKGFRIADNQTGKSAKWDFEILAREIEDLRKDEFDLDQIGFSKIEIEGFLAGEINIDNFLSASEKKERQPKEVECPNCGMRFTPT